MPDMDFRGSPIGIDILKEVETGISPSSIPLLPVNAPVLV